MLWQCLLAVDNDLIINSLLYFKLVVAPTDSQLLSNATGVLGAI
jgi:hypothetical protein